MSDDKKNTYAVPFKSTQDVGHRLDGARRAVQVRDPITGFFHGLGSKAATRALLNHAAETDALAKNLAAQATVVRAMISLQDAMDDYQAREELSKEHYQLAKERQELAMRQKKAEAEWLALEAEHRLEAKNTFKPMNFELGKKRKQADIAEVEQILPAEEPIKVEHESDAILEMLGGELSDALKYGEEPDQIYKMIAERQAWLAQKKVS